MFDIEIIANQIAADPLFIHILSDIQLQTLLKTWIHNSILMVLGTLNMFYAVLLCMNLHIMPVALLLCLFVTPGINIKI